jgi:hypothetical protein
LEIVKIDANKVSGIKIARDATIDDTNIVDDGNRRSGSPSLGKSSPVRSIEAGGEIIPGNGAKPSPKDGRPSLTRCNSSPSQETVDATRNVISAAKNSGSDDVNGITKRGDEVDGIFTPVEKAKETLLLLVIMLST